jgi:hypothetical protein
MNFREMEACDVARCLQVRALYKKLGWEDSDVQKGQRIMKLKKPSPQSTPR